jgi:hypothetical protein
MKKNYIFTALMTLCLTGASFGQTTVFQESFETSNSGVASEMCNDNSSDFFTRTDGSDITSAYEVSGQDGDFFFAAMDTDGLPCTMATQTLTFDDIDISSKSNLTLSLLLAEDQPSDDKYDWDGGDLFYIEVDYDNSGTFTKILQFATSATSGYNVSAPMQDTDLDGIGDGQALSAVFSEFTIGLGTGNLVDVRLVFYKLNSADEDIAVDNIRIIDGFVSAPSLVISSPTNNKEFNPSTSEVNVTFAVSNFTLSGDNGFGVTDNSGDGYIKTTLELVGEINENANLFTLTLPAIEVAAGKSYLVTAELVDNSGASLNPKLEESISFNIASYTDVANLAALRAGTEGMYYRITGEVVVTYTTANRNQKYIQDSTGALLIDDSANVLAPGNYISGDGITNINGKLGSYGNVVQIVPADNSGTKSSTGNTVTSQVVSLTDLTSNLNNYESEWVRVNNVSFADADGTAVFEASKNYDITDGTNTLVFRTNFGSADFIGNVIPSVTVNITGIAGEFNGTSQINGISSANIVLGLSRENIEGFATYPNPVTNNKFTIKSNSSDKKQVSIYNVLGKKVLETRFSGTKSDINVSTINAGIYILKVTESGKTATKKLVIR